MFYYSRTKTKLDEKRWKNIKTYKWTDTSRELLIEALSDENIKNEILGFELNNITENQDGVDEATRKLTQMLHSISDRFRLGTYLVCQYDSSKLNKYY